MGIAERTLVVGYWLFCAALGILTLAVDSTVYKVIALAVVTAIALAVLIWAARAGAARASRLARVHDARTPHVHVLEDSVLASPTQ